MAMRLFAVLRTIIVSILFLSIWTWFVPRWVTGNGAFDNPRPLGWIVIALGVSIAFACALEFAWRGIGTPAPFDPPRRLVITGLYRWVRNPMYVGAGAALAGAALYYRSLPLFAYAAAFMLAAHLFVVAYEEPVLRAKFGDDYAAYCRRVARWLPHARASTGKAEGGAA